MEYDQKNYTKDIGPSIINPYDKAKFVSSGRKITIICTTIINWVNQIPNYT